MADGTSPPLTPKEAIAIGMRYFTDFMEGQSCSRVLLEGLELDEKSGNWVVTFGFDSSRAKPYVNSPFASALGAALAATAILREPEMELVREFRAVHLSSESGEFIKLEHA